MTELHNALNRGPWSAALQNALGVTRGEGGLERYGETLEAVIDLWRLPEWRYLRRERQAMMRTTEGVGAGRSRLGIQNATTTDLVVVEAIQVPALTTVSLTLGTGLTVDSVEFLRPMDTRWFTPSAGASVALLTHRQGTIGGTSTSLGTITVPQGVLTPLNVVVGPGWHLSLDPGADATAIIVTFFIRERTAQRGEL